MHGAYVRACAYKHTYVRTYTCLAEWHAYTRTCTLERAAYVRILARKCVFSTLSIKYVDTVVEYAVLFTSLRIRGCDPTERRVS